MNDATAPSRRTLLKVAVVSLTIAALVLAGFLYGATGAVQTKVLATGEHRDLSPTPYAAAHTIQVPGSEILVAVAPPVSELDAGIVTEVDGDEPDDPMERVEKWVAPEGGSIVPVTWRVRRFSELDRQVLARPIELRLVAGDERIDVTTIELGPSSDRSDALEGTSRAHALKDEVDLDDLRVEVEYDGLTQVLNPATGEIDAGAAQPLYEELRTVGTGCEPAADDCELRGLREDAPVRPFDGALIVHPLDLHPYDRELGWAEEGHLWASVDVHSYNGHAKDAAGNTFVTQRHGPITVKLDGEGPARREGLRSRALGVAGTAVFSVATDAAPAKLTVATWWKLDDGSRLPLRRTLRLQPVQ